MSSFHSLLADRFAGSLLGLAIGDALGAAFEAQSPAAIRARFGSVEELIEYPDEEMWYTDDTQMAIGVAEALIEDGEIMEKTLCRAFVENYDPPRGYGRGARAVLSAMWKGEDYRAVAEDYFPGGSFGNGAAMRVAPVGLLFRDDFPRLLEQARLSSLPTHLHPLGIEGAQLLALAVGIASRMNSFVAETFFSPLISACQSGGYRAKLDAAQRAKLLIDIEPLGNGIEAENSVPAAIACFAISPESYEETIANAIFLGGDTDTIAAMAGAISGAYLGVDGLPSRLLNLLESSPKGRDYLRELAAELHEAYERAKQTGR